MLQHGAVGYLLKTDQKETICAALRAISQNKIYISPQLQKSKTHTQGSSRKFICLTPREKQILQLILSEKTTKEIATSIFLSTKTVETYRANLLIKFNARNMAGLVKKAILEGYI